MSDCGFYHFNFIVYCRFLHWNLLRVSILMIQKAEEQKERYQAKEIPYFLERKRNYSIPLNSLEFDQFEIYMFPSRSLFVFPPFSFLEHSTRSAWAKLNSLAHTITSEFYSFIRLLVISCLYILMCRHTFSLSVSSDYLIYFSPLKIDLIETSNTILLSFFLSSGLDRRSVRQSDNRRLRQQHT